MSPYRKAPLNTTWRSPRIEKHHPVPPGAVYIPSWFCPPKNSGPYVRHVLLTLTDKKLSLLIVVLFGFLNIKSVNKIYAIPYLFFNSTIIVQVRYIIIETKEFARIRYNGLLFPYSYSGDGLDATHLGLNLIMSTHADKKPVISNTCRFFCFNSTVSYTKLRNMIITFVNDSVRNRCTFRV